MCTAGSHFTGLILNAMGVITTGKSELRYQPCYTGYLNRKYAHRLLSALLGCVKDIIEDQSFLIHIPGYLSKTPDSQGGKPP